MAERPSPASFPPGWAFVVQLCAGTSFDAAQLHGRIEHVETAHACLFNSLEEARAFMERVMATADGKSS